MDTRDPMPLKSPDVLAVTTLGQLAAHPRVVALRDFITAWHVSYLSVDSTRCLPEAGPQGRLSRTGDNLANLIQHLSEQHPEQLSRIFRKLRQRVPRVERGLSEPLADGRLLLQIKDSPFESPGLARFSSDGTLKLLAYLVLLHNPQTPPFIGFEEPENYLYPRLLHDLAEECRSAGSRTQLLVATHSPYFVNALNPRDVQFLWRDRKGYTRTRRASDMEGVKTFMENGALLGDLWMGGYIRIDERSITPISVSPGP